MSQTQFVGPNAVYRDPTQETCLQQIIYSYLYIQYQDDDNLQALVQAQNQYATQFLLWFNGLNLPIYTGGIVFGPLLDWVGQGIYGIPRPTVTSGTSSSVAATAQYKTGLTGTAMRKITSNQTQQTTNDDIYRRVMTWNLYKGDGFVFSIPWLKRRVFRFINGVNGVPPTIDQTFPISVTVSGSTFTINVTAETQSLVTFLQNLIQNGACTTPFQYNFTLVWDGPTFTDDGGELNVSDTAAYPASSSGLAAGAIWSNGGVVSVVPGVTPNPTAPPVYFGVITAAELLALGGGNLPLTSQAPGSLQLWNNGGSVGIS